MNIGLANIICDDEDRLALDILCGPRDGDCMTQREARTQLLESFTAMLDELVGGEYDKDADKNPEWL